MHARTPRYLRCCKQSDENHISCRASYTPPGVTCPTRSHTPRQGPHTPPEVLPGVTDPRTGMSEPMQASLVQTCSKREVAAHTVCFLCYL
eukprot:365592-Chlamydomonas_euryale.AAC.15